MTVELSHSLYANLKIAFAAEAAAFQRFTYFAQVAEIEGHLELSKLFTELAESTACAAHGHIDWLQYVADPITDRPIGETHLNLAASLTSELNDGSDLYPRLAEAAHTEGMADVASWLETMCALKKAHVDRIERALAALTERFGAAP